MLERLIILLILSLIPIVFYLAYIGRDKFALKILVFFVPSSLLQYWLSGQGFDVSLNFFLIWAIVIGKLLSNSLHKVSRSVAYPLLFLTGLGFVNGWIFYDLNIKLDTSGTALRLPYLYQLFNVSIWLITIIGFIALFQDTLADKKFWKSLIHIFTLTAFYHLIVDLEFAKTSLTNSFLRPFLAHPHPMEYGNLSEVRVNGLFANSGTTADYCLIVIALSLIALITGRNYRLVSSMTIFAALFVGLLLGTRSFILVLIGFTFIYIFAKLFLGSGVKTKLKLLGVVLIVLVVGLLVFNNYIYNFTVFQRLNDTVGLISQQKYREAANRDIAGIPIAIQNSSIFGNGSLYFNEINNHQMVSHNALLHAYVRYGIIGVVLLIYLFLRNGLFLFKGGINSKEHDLAEKSFLLLALLTSLFVQELKISALRDLTPMLMYTFLFLYIQSIKYDSPDFS